MPAPRIRRRPRRLRLAVLGVLGLGTGQRNISAAMLMAVSSGVRAPISSPIGLLMRARSSTPTTRASTT
jgi:hypothetical protein